LSYRVRSLIHECGIEVDHVTVHRWVQRFTPLLIEAARPCRHKVGDRRFVDETYVKVNGVWRYAYRAVEQRGQVIDVFVSRHRDIPSARPFFTKALAAHRAPAEVITDRAPGPANVIEELTPAAFHNTGPYENNRCECDHGRLKARLRPMRGLKTDRTALRRNPKTCIHPEPEARPLRTRSRGRAGVPAGNRIRRTQARDLKDPASAHDPARPVNA
jgi:transposase-like protein